MRPPRLYHPVIRLAIILAFELLCVWGVRHGPLGTADAVAMALGIFMGAGYAVFASRFEARGGDDLAKAILERRVRGPWWVYVGVVFGFVLLDLIQFYISQHVCFALMAGFMLGTLVGYRHWVRFWARLERVGREMPRLDA